MLPHPPPPPPPQSFAMSWLRQKVFPSGERKPTIIVTEKMGDIDVVLSAMAGVQKKRREGWPTEEGVENYRDKMFLNHYADPNPVLTGIWALAAKWKGSVFKLVRNELLVFSLCFTSLSLLYRLVLFNNPAQRETFELICVWFNKFSGLIPIAFLMGFYITHVVSRWWDQYMALPFPDKIAIKLSTFVPGKDPFRRNLRRTVMRHLNLSSVLVFRLVSPAVRKRYPDYDALVDARILLPHEKRKLERMDAITPYELTALPVVWATSLLHRAREDGLIVVEASLFAQLIPSFDYVQDCNRRILNYGWVNLPLVYTQVVAISVLMYFVSALFGRQYLIPRDVLEDDTIFPHLNVSYSGVTPFDAHTPDFFVPVFTLIELISYMGWMNVAEALLNPYGEDEEDFNINYLIERNMSVCYRIVDEAEMGMTLGRDPFTGICADGNGNADNKKGLDLTVKY